MISVAADLRRVTRERVLALAPEDRIALTARLAEDDLALFTAARRIPRAEACRLLVGARQTGRRASRVAQDTAE